MRRGSTDWRSFALLVAAATACSGEVQESGETTPSPPSESPEPTALLVAPEAVPVTDPGLPAPVAAPARPRTQPAPTLPAGSTSYVPIEKLLQVPGGSVARPPEPEIDEVIRRYFEAELADENADADAEAAGGHKLRIDLGVQTDQPVERRGLKREQVDAGAAIDVGKDTSVKGGVRIERDSVGGVESKRNTTPTIGIEKRF